VWFLWGVCGLGWGVVCVGFGGRETGETFLLLESRGSPVCNKNISENCRGRQNVIIF